MNTPNAKIITETDSAPVKEFPDKSNMEGIQQNLMHALEFARELARQQESEQGLVEEESETAAE